MSAERRQKHETVMQHAKLLVSKLSADVELLKEGRGPRCHECNGASKHFARLDHPIYGDPERNLYQFHCLVCGALIEEVR